MNRPTIDRNTLEILGTRNDTRRSGSEMASEWLARLGLFSLMTGAFSLIGWGARDTKANDPAVEPPRPESPDQTAPFKRVSGPPRSRPALLRRQSEFRLPIQKKSFSASRPAAPPDDCPGVMIPPGSYTSASPYTVSGDTTGANDTVENYDGGYYYSWSGGPDHIYTFTLTALGSNPRISVSAASGGFSNVIYVLNGLRNGRCPSGVDNWPYSVSGGFGANQQGNIAMPLDGLPLNVPLHLAIDSWGGGGTAYTFRLENVTVGPSVVPPENDAPMDLDADGKSDFPIVRNTGPGGQLTWFTRTSDNQFLPTATWGVQGDKPVSGDFDGDGQDDLVVWRPGTQGRFYIIGSRTQTIRVEDFGQTGDDPTVVRDYDLDGIDDLAVYRGGVLPGDQSYWYYRSVASPPGNLERIGWGQYGDRPVPGSFSPYGSILVVQRPDGPNGRFYFRYPWGYSETFVYGQANDTLVPGDYHGDGYADLTLVRVTNDGFLAWYVQGNLYPKIWGVAATDQIAPGDYNGDGRTDIAVWRPGSPGMFYVCDWETGRVDTIPWGQVGDVPVATFMKH